MVSKEKLKQQREELEQARAIFEAHKLRMEDVNRRQLTKGTEEGGREEEGRTGKEERKELTDVLIVKLNIGGIRYETSVATLAKDGQSMLAAMFSGLYPLQQDKDDGSIFIDRDGTHFRYILKYDLPSPLSPLPSPLSPLPPCPSPLSSFLPSLLDTPRTRSRRRIDLHR